MTLTSIGDLAQTFVMRRQNAALKSRMSQLTLELATGRSADLVRHLGGNMTWLSDIEHQTVVQGGYQTAAREAGITAGAMQSALGRVHELARDLGANAVVAGSTVGSTARNTAAVEARGALEAMIAALNISVAGRPVFAGTDLSTPPLLAGEGLLDAARSATAGAVTAADVASALDVFFGPGGGFETDVYQGNTDDVAAIRLGAGAAVQLSIRADDVALRSVMKNTVMTALADDPGLMLDDAARDTLIGWGAEGLLTQSDALVEIQANLGFAESRIAQAESRISSELSALEIARNTLTSVDPFDTASELEEVQFQLETIYTVTARSSRLNLASFLS
ncbi:flagellin [Roseovarius pelagicus]|uniref:Flagellin n=1 Tax=Roseovarius pelagicus TaxID=2980108 RepID=A0ABY6D845_9RHOB|nr:flagellin [Roseovarius pelagicus]UXX82268.1 flagellin [Roseovarius pelagicus]